MTTNRRELADRLEAYDNGSVSERPWDIIADATEAVRLLREPVAPEPLLEEAVGLLRVVGVAHLYRLDPRAVPVVIAAPTPNRHHNLFALVCGRRPDESGFILSDGSFADRKRACVIAVSNGQADPAKMTVPGTLFSEDLW